MHAHLRLAKRVGSFPPVGYGLFDMAGNVWAWTADWYADRHQVTDACCGGAKPAGDDRERSDDPRQPEFRVPRKVLKGGSFLCAPNSCLRYRPAARIAQPIGTGTYHQGFRRVARVAAPPVSADQRALMRRALR